MDIGYWFICKSSHPGYENAIPPEECPMPCIIEDPVNTNNTDEDEDGIEPTFEGQRFSGTNTKIDPVLRLYPHAPFMCNSTKDVKKGRGNGTLCRFVSIKLKDGVILDWKNWNGRKVNAVSANVVEWVRFQHWPEPPRNINQFFNFKLRPCQYTSNCLFRGLQMSQWILETL